MSTKQTNQNIVYTVIILPLYLGQINLATEEVASLGWAVFYLTISLSLWPEITKTNAVNTWFKAANLQSVQ